MLPALSHGMLLSWCSDFPLLTFWGAAAIACLPDYFKLLAVFRKSCSAGRSPVYGRNHSTEPSTGEITIEANVGR
jgi:hypothetical protein